MASNTQLKEAVLEAQAEGALGGHSLGPFEAVENGYQATCRHCGKTTWVGEQGLRYSLLGERCSGRDNDSQ